MSQNRQQNTTPQMTPTSSMSSLGSLARPSPRNGANVTRAAPNQTNPPLPGTLMQLLEIDSDKDAASPMSPSGSLRPPPPKDDPDILPPPMSLPEQVDDFGWTLVAAIRDFRTHVEDVFTEHYQAMKRAEDAHKLTLAKLVAENTQMRERLGLNIGPQLHQNLHFQPMAYGKNDEGKRIQSQEQQLMREFAGEVENQVEAKKNDRISKDRRRGSKQDSAGLRKNQSHNSAAARPIVSTDPLIGGGNWETFVAWVPAGAALGCCQPWKPLANEAFVPPDLAEVKMEEDAHLDISNWKVLEMWEGDKEELAELRKDCFGGFKGIIPPIGEKSNSMKRERSSDAEDGEVVAPAWFVVHPLSGKRIFWDLCSLLLVLYDMIMIPMAFFDLTEGTFIEVMVWTTRVFWTLDMGASVCTSVSMPNGTIKSDVKFIVTRYLKTWFVLDAFIVASDWIEFIISFGSDDSGGGGFGKLARIFRIVRSVRLLRLMRMQSVMQTITERVQSDYLSFVLVIVKLALFLVSAAHIIACFWWGIGRRGGATWSEIYLHENISLSARYLISLHWTLSQFTGGMEEIRPAAPIERFFVIIIWTIAFMSAAIIASILTSSLVQAHIIGGSQARQLATLRKYLIQNSISKNLSLRVQKSARHAISGDLSPDAVDLLGVVSEQLRLEMHFEMYSEVFRVHPFFDQCFQVVNTVMRRICHQATSTLLLDAGDVLFSKGEAPAEPQMYFFFKGTLEYTPTTGDPIIVGDRQWIAEPVLWLQWVHRGQLKAVTDVKVAKLDARRFQDVVQRFQEVFPSGFNPKVYAHDYAQQLNDLPNADQVNDLSGIYMS